MDIKTGKADKKQKSREEYILFPFGRPCADHHAPGPGTYFGVRKHPCIADAYKNGADDMPPRDCAHALKTHIGMAQSTCRRV